MDLVELAALREFALRSAHNINSEHQQRARV